MVSAFLLGGNVTVKRGQLDDGDFAHSPGCSRRGQTGCVIAFSTFNETPPDNSRYGRVGGGDAGNAFEFPQGPEYEVLCTNPASLARNRDRPLHTLVRTEPYPGIIGVLLLQTYGGLPPTRRHAMGSAPGPLHGALRDRQRRERPLHLTGRRRPAAQPVARARMGPSPDGREHRARQPRAGPHRAEASLRRRLIRVRDGELDEGLRCGRRRFAPEKRDRKLDPRIERPDSRAADLVALRTSGGGRPRRTRARPERGSGQGRSPRGGSSGGWPIPRARRPSRCAPPSHGGKRSEARRRAPRSASGSLAGEAVAPAYRDDQLLDRDLPALESCGRVAPFERESRVQLAAPEMVVHLLRGAFAELDVDAGWARLKRWRSAGTSISPAAMSAPIETVPRDQPTQLVDALPQGIGLGEAPREHAPRPTHPLPSARLSALSGGAARLPARPRAGAPARTAPTGRREAPPRPG